MKKYVRTIILAAAIALITGCAYFDSQHSSPEPLALPAGKHWQIVEEPPKLSDDSGRLPFQKEQSVQPEIAKPPLPEKKRTVETPL